MVTLWGSSGPRVQRVTADACDDCGLRVSDPQQLLAQRRSFARRVVHRCALCARRHATRVDDRLWAVQAAFIALLLAAGFAVGGAFLSLAALPLGILAGTALGVLVHEAAHAVAAWSLGLSVWRVELGRGRRLFGWRWRGVEWNLRRVPLTGFVIFSHTRERWVATSHALVVAAGPAANAGLLLAAAAVFFGTGWSGGPASAWFPLLLGFAMAQALLLQASLWPRTHAFDSANLPSDGLQLLSLARDRGRELREKRELLNLGVEVVERLRRDETEEALTALRSADPEDAADPAVRAMGLIPLLRLGAFEEAFDEGLTMLEEVEELPDPTRALLLNTTAWAGVLTGRPERAEQLLAMADEAVALLPGVGAFRSTRGACLLLAGEAAEARRVLERASADDPEEAHRPLYDALLSRVRVWAGNTEAADRFEAAARRLGGSAVICPRWRRCSPCRCHAMAASLLPEIPSNPSRV